VTKAWRLQQIRIGGAARERDEEARINLVFSSLPASIVLGVHELEEVEAKRTLATPYLLRQKLMSWELRRGFNKIRLRLDMDVFAEVRSVRCS
jgi:hypothetical protein